MSKKAWTIAKINLRTLRILWLPASTTALAMLISSVISAILMRTQIEVGSDISPINALWLMPVMVAIAIPAFSYRRVINLGGKRNSFFAGGIITYVVIAAIVSFFVTLFNFTIEPIFERSAYFDPNFLGGIVNLVEVFGWANRGFMVAFFQQFAFLVFFSAFVHTLAAAHSRWYGWVADVAIIAIISVFTPIPILRRSLVWFFNLILFHPNALVQIAGCLVLAAVVYGISKPILARKAL